MAWAAIGSVVVGSVLNRRKGGGGGGGSAAQSFTQDFTTTGGMFGGTRFDNGRVQRSMDFNTSKNQIEGLRGARRFGQQIFDDPGVLAQREAGLGFMNQLSMTNPLQLQQQLFQQQAGLLQPQFARDTLNLENRLFQQGRLGGTAGSQQQEALATAQGNTFGQLLANAFAQSQAQQSQTALLGQGLLSGAQNLQAGIIGNQSGLLGNALAIQGAQDASLQTDANINRVGQGAVSPNPGVGQLLGQGLITAGAGGISNAIGSLFQPGTASAPLPTAIAPGVSPSTAPGTPF